MRRQPLKKIVDFLWKSMEEGKSVGVKITFKYTRKLGRERWERTVEGKVRRLVNMAVVIDEGSVFNIARPKKYEVRVPLREVLWAYRVVP